MSQGSSTSSDKELGVLSGCSESRAGVRCPKGSRGQSPEQRGPKRQGARSKGIREGSATGRGAHSSERAPVSDEEGLSGNRARWRGGGTSSQGVWVCRQRPGAAKSLVSPASSMHRTTARMRVRWCGSDSHPPVPPSLPRNLAHSSSSCGVSPSPGSLP